MYEAFYICASEMYQRKYMDFLLKNYEDLRLPYSFPVAFRFIASPVLLLHECFLCVDEDGEAVGAFSYIHGTGEGNYEDRHIVQLQVAYLISPKRRTALFLLGMHTLAEHLNDLNEEVTELVFWTGTDAYAGRLFSKFAERTSIGESVVEYRVSLNRLNTYLSKFKRRIPV